MYDNSQTEELKSHLRDYVESHLTRDKRNRKMFVCPFCGSGGKGGRNSDGAFSVKDNYYKCFSCNATGDIFNLIGQVEQIPDFKEQKARAIELYGTYTPAPVQKKKDPEPPVTPVADFSQYIKECALAVDQTDYLKGRGFTDDTIKRFALGYDVNYKSIVIPYGKDNKYYITRSVADKRFYKPKTEVAGAEPIFNLEAMYSGEPCFICESQLDAISIEQAGGRSIAIGGSGYNKLIDEVISRRPTETLILSLDNDDKGKEFTSNIADKLTELKIPFIQAEYSQDLKDANEMLQKDPVKLSEDLKSNIQRALGAVIDDETSKLLHTSNISNYIMSGLGFDLKSFRDHNNRSTGFSFLDDMSGGLYNGFYVIGAISSLGKTTFIHQIADNLAEAGDHILYFSLEQSKLELVTKSLSRIIAKKHGTKDPVSSIAIRNGYITDQQKSYIREALAEYQKIANRVTIIECTFNADIEFIRATTEAYIKANRVKPVVIVDYLQIINAEGNYSDKQKIDNIVKGLKKLQSDNKLVLIAISSVNRSNYLTPVDFESFKESGIIEYSTDVVYGLQLQALRDPDFLKDGDIVKKRKKIVEAKSASPRKIELVCLKNRYGISNYSTFFDYYPNCDYFREDLTAVEKYEIKKSNNRL